MKFLEDKLRGIGPSALKTLIELHRISKGDNEFQIGIEELAETLEISSNSVRKHMKILEEMDFLEVKPVMDSVNRCLPNVYILKDDRDELMEELFLKN